MKNLATLNVHDYLIKEDGSCYCTQQVAANLCGVSQSAINQFCLSNKVDTKQGLTPKNLELLITHYAFDAKQHCTETARQSAKSLMHGGAKAFIYHQAGYKINAEPSVPKSYGEALIAAGKIQLKLECALVNLTETETKLDQTENELESSNLQLDKSQEYITIKRMALCNNVDWTDYSWRKLKATGSPIVKIFDANYGHVNAYHITAWVIAYPNVKLPTN
jgi:hypothetical protein